MSAEANDRPVPKEPEAEVIDLEVVDDGSGSRPGSASGEHMSPEELMAMAPDVLVQVFRGIIKEKLKKWFIRSLIWATVLIFFAREHTWARVCFVIWAVIASIHLAFLLYGWYASGKQGARLARAFSGMTGSVHGQIRED